MYSDTFVGQIKSFPHVIVKLSRVSYIKNFIVTVSFLQMWKVVWSVLWSHMHTAS